MPRQRQDGYALVLVLWLITLLAMLSLRHQSVARMEALDLAMSLHRAEATAAAEAGVWLGLESILEAAPRARSSYPPATRQFEFNGIDVTVSLQDVSGLININRAPGELLDAALAATDLDAVQREQIVTAMLDWRDTDLDARGGGQEAQVLTTDWGKVEVRNGFFATVDELRAMPGMTDAAYRAVRNRFTVFGDHRRINAEAATEEVLSILPGASAAAIEGYLAEREDSGSGRGASLGGASRRYLQGSGENILLITSTATVNGVTARLTPVIEISRQADRNISILSWSGDAS